MLVTARVVGSPTASAEIFDAAERYCSSNDGEILSTSAMLSKPYASSSAGRNSAGSISSASRSRIALPYSVRFSRWTPTWPGSGRSEEHTSELQSRENIVCRLLLEKKKLYTF